MLDLDALKHVLDVGDGLDRETSLALIAEVERLRAREAGARDLFVTLAVSVYGGEKPTSDDLKAWTVSVSEWLGARPPCKHERATYVRMLDELRQVFTCDDCGWEHYTAVDPGTGDLVNFDAATGEAQAHR